MTYIEAIDCLRNNGLSEEQIINIDGAIRDIARKTLTYEDVKKWLKERGLTTEKVDCRYCTHSSCGSPTDKTCDCCSDGGFFEGTVTDPEKEAQKCLLFFYDDTFPKT